MSASKQKQVRSDLRASGNNQKSKAQLEQEKKSRDFRRNTIIFVVIFVVVVGAALFINSNYLYNGVPALSVNNTNYSAAEFSYFYRSAYNSFVNSYGDYVSMFGLDTSQPLTEQQSSFSDEENPSTWADYFKQQAEDNLCQLTALYDDAQKNGFSITEEGQEIIDNNISTIESYASSYGVRPSAYLASVYGKGMTEDVFRKVLTRHVMASEYSEHVSDSFTYTDEELAEYYDTIRDNYDSVTYYVHYFRTDDEAYADLDADEAKEQVIKDAEYAAKAKDADAFVERVAERADMDSESISATTTTRSSLSSYYPEYGEWLLEDSRKEGDTTTIQDEIELDDEQDSQSDEQDSDSEDSESEEPVFGTYALMFISANDGDYNLVNVRHILIKAEADEDGNYSDEALDAARERIEEIQAEWEENPTEDHFAELANEYSEDSGSNTNGGLYENVQKNQMVTEFNDFCFEEGRKSGDTGIVYGNNDSYAGYHLIYFVGEGPLYSHYVSENDLRSQDAEEYIENITEGYTATEKYAMRFVTLD